MKSWISRVAVAALAAGAALSAGAPAAHAEGGVALRVTLSGTTPEVSAAAEPGSPEGLVAAVTGYVDGVRVDADRCSVETSDLAAFAAGRGSAYVSGCTGTDLAFDVVSAGGGGAASLRIGPGPGSCVLLCSWYFDVMSGSWVLDCPWGAAPA